MTASAGIAGWFEMLLLRSTLNARIGKTGLPIDYVVKLWSASLAAAAVAWAIKLALPALHPIVMALLVAGPYGLVFFALAAAFRVPEVSNALNRVIRRR